MRSLVVELLPPSIQRALAPAWRTALQLLAHVPVQALVRGLLFMRASFPDLVTEESAFAALERLLR